MEGKNMHETQAAGSTDRLAYGIAEAGAVLGIGRSSMYQLISEGKIATVSIGRRRLVLRAELERFAKRTGLEVATDIDEVDVERELKLALFRSLQELLTNIARHAKATSVEVKLQQKDGRITLSLRDDGIGFYPDERRKSSLGLVGITERIMAHDGTMDIVSRPGFGTFVKIEVAARDDAMERALEAAKQSAD